MDALTVERLKPVHPELGRRVASLSLELESPPLAVVLRVVQGLRTWEQQDELWAQGRTTPGAPCRHNGVVRPVGTCEFHPLGLPITKARGGQSMHNFGGAVDTDPNDPRFSDWHPDFNEADERWAALLSAASRHGLAEGAKWRTFPDTPHLYPQELPASPDDTMRQVYAQGGLPAVWEDWVTRYSLPLA